MAKIILKTAAGRFTTLVGGLALAAAVWVGFGGSMQAAPPAPDPVTCVPTCEVDGRSLVSAGDDNTTLSSQEIVLGLGFTAAAGPDGNFELFDGDNNQANWDVLFNCGSGCPGNGALAPQLIVELFADPAGIGGAGAPLMVWSPAGTPFPTTNNGWSGVTFTHDASAVNGTDYLYAVHIRPFTPETDKGWNAFKVRAAGTVILLGNQVVGFLGAMNNPGDLTTIYPHWNELPVGSNLSDSPYDGTWVFKTRLPSFLGDVTVFDGDMDFGNAACAYNDTDDPDSSNAAVPPFAIGSAAVPEGVALANAPNACPDPPGGTRTGTPAEDATSAAFRRVPGIIPAGIGYQLKAPGSQQNPNGQIFLNQNPSGNKEWEQFKIQLVDDASDIPNGACPVGGYPEDIPNGYAASDCRTTDLPGGVWEVQLDGMDLSNLNFWFFSFKVEPIETEYSIGRLVWYDANENQQQDMCGPDPCAEEPGIGGVAYTVYHFETPGIPDGTVARAGVTNSDPNHLTLKVGEFLEEGLPAGNYKVEVDASNFAAAAPLNGLTSTTGGEIELGIEVGLPVCIDTNNPVGCGQPGYNEAIFGYFEPAPTPYFIVIDEDSIDNGIGPNFFNAHQVNDHKAKIGLRAVLPRFNGIYIGTELILYTGQTMDEGWFSVPTIPASWAAAGPTTDGLKNFVGVGNAVGPGLGKGNDPEKLLDKIPDVTPWNAPMLFASVGSTFCAVVYDSDISINYNLLIGSLKGANLGIVAFQVLEVTPRTDGSSSSLPQVRLLILDAIPTCTQALINATVVPPS